MQVSRVILTNRRSGKNMRISSPGMRQGSKAFEMVERFAFYERAKKAYAILATSEAALYANIIIKKGVVK